MGVLECADDFEVSKGTGQSGDILTSIILLIRVIQMIKEYKIIR